jgi:hypothetical protein
LLQNTYEHQQKSCEKPSMASSPLAERRVRASLPVQFHYRSAKLPRKS